MTIHFNLHTTGEGESSSVTFASNGALVTVPADHPNFKRVVHALAEGNDPIEFVDVETAVGQFSDRVTVLDHAVLFDGEEIAGGVTRTILRYKNEGRDTANLVRFLERVQQNPSRHSREGLWRWVESTDLHVAEDGRIVAWKSVEVVDGDEWVDIEEGEDVPEDVEVRTSYGFYDAETGEHEERRQKRIPGEETYRSHSSGTAYVNGVKHEGKIPYAVGDIVTMPREEVEDDPSVACHVGLHIGSFDYASTFGRSGSKVLEVAVAPEDVVSVPNDSNGEKIRCCRFEVLAVQDRPTPDLTHYEPEGEEWDEDAADEEILASIEDEVDRTFIGRLLERFRKGDA